MADRKVTGTSKNSDGDIIGLCGPWGTCTSEEAIADIDNGTHRYYVEDDAGNQADIHVVDDPDGRYLRTDPDASAADNLDNLPDCP